MYGLFYFSTIGCQITKPDDIQDNSISHMKPFFAMAKIELYHTLNSKIKYPTKTDEPTKLRPIWWFENYHNESCSVGRLATQEGETEPIE